MTCPPTTPSASKKDQEGFEGLLPDPQTVSDPHLKVPAQINCQAESCPRGLCTCYCLCLEHSYSHRAAPPLRSGSAQKSALNKAPPPTLPRLTFPPCGSPATPCFVILQDTAPLTMRTTCFVFPLPAVSLQCGSPPGQGSPECFLRDKVHFKGWFSIWNAPVITRAAQAQFQLNLNS